MKILIISLLFVFLSIYAYAGKWTFKGDNYIVETDKVGEINSFIVNGEEFLESTYFFYSPFEKKFIKEDNKKPTRREKRKKTKSKSPKETNIIIPRFINKAFTCP